MSLPLRLLFVLHFMAFSVSSDYTDNLFPLDNSTVHGVVGTDNDALLVAQESSVTFFKLGDQQTLRPEKIGRFPATPDNSSFLTVAHVVNDTHFVYCGERRCR